MLVERGSCHRWRLAKRWLIMALIMTLAACGGTPSPSKIALLAPFEGQYREIGYNALYAMRLAFADAAPPSVQLLAVDDGGTLESAVARVRALNLDPAVVTIIALGPFATQSAPQAANEKPMIMIGNWGQDIAGAHSLQAGTVALDGKPHNGDLYMLWQVRELADKLEQIRFVSSGSLPDEAFRQRYLNSVPYAPQPNLLATLTYDIARLALAALARGREISQMEYYGINGLIRFEDGYWVDAPSKGYRYEQGQLVLDLD